MAAVNCPETCPPLIVTFSVESVRLLYVLVRPIVPAEMEELSSMVISTASAFMIRRPTLSVASAVLVTSMLELVKMMSPLTKNPCMSVLLLTVVLVKVDPPWTEGPMSASLKLI